MSVSDLLPLTRFFAPLPLEELTGSPPDPIAVLLIAQIPAIVVPVTPVLSRDTPMSRLARELILRPAARRPAVQLVRPVAAIVVAVTAELGAELTVTALERVTVTPELGAVEFIGAVTARVIPVTP